MVKIDENMGITLTRGNSASFALTIEDSKGSSYDYSNDVVRLGIKRSPFDATCLIEKTIDKNGNFVFVPADTASLEFGDYYYDVEVQHTIEAETEGEEDEVQVYTVIAAARFTLGFNIL